MKCVWLWWLCASVVFANNTVNEKVSHKVDATKSIVTSKVNIEYSMLLQTDGYHFSLNASLAEKVALMYAKCNGKPCDVKSVKSTGEYYEYKIEPKLDAGKMEIHMQYTHSLVPYPNEILQSEKQFVVFEVNKRWLTNYETKWEQLSIKLPNNDVEYYTPDGVLKGKKVVFGPYEKTIGNAVEKMDMARVHFRNHAKFMTLTNVVKEIEVSMWGSVSVEETYDLMHTGAKLKGGFSRLDYSMGNSKSASFDRMDAVLPKDVENVYYRDIIGNITTSRLRRKKTHCELELTPRFPIFGGWKTQWYMGYNVPTHGVLKHDDDLYTLSMAFSTPMEDANVDQINVKVILPEGAKNINVKVPFDVDEQSRTLRHTYLDNKAIGRPVVSIYKKNLVPMHNVPFEVTFEFKKVYMLHELGLLVAGFMAFFVFCMIWFRLDFSLVDHPKTMSKKTKTE